MAAIGGNACCWGEACGAAAPDWPARDAAAPLRTCSCGNTYHQACANAGVAAAFHDSADPESMDFDGEACGMCGKRGADATAQLQQAPGAASLQAAAPPLAPERCCTCPGAGPLPFVLRLGRNDTSQAAAQQLIACCGSLRGSGEAVCDAPNCTRTADARSSLQLCDCCNSVALCGGCAEAFFSAEAPDLAGVNGERVQAGAAPFCGACLVTRCKRADWYKSDMDAQADAALALHDKCVVQRDALVA